MSNRAHILVIVFSGSAMRRSLRQAHDLIAINILQKFQYAEKIHRQSSRRGKNVGKLVVGGCLTVSLLTLLRETVKTGAGTLLSISIVEFYLLGG